MSVGPKWQDIAADMIEAKGFSINGDADDATITAAAFVFDEGILFMHEKTRAEVVTMLRAAASMPLIVTGSEGGGV